MLVEEIDGSLINILLSFLLSIGNCNLIIEFTSNCRKERQKTKMKFFIYYGLLPI